MKEEKFRVGDLIEMTKNDSGYPQCIKGSRWTISLVSHTADVLYLVDKKNNNTNVWMTDVKLIKRAQEPSPKKAITRERLLGLLKNTAFEWIGESDLTIDEFCEMKLNEFSKSLDL